MLTCWGLIRRGIRNRLWCIPFRETFWVSWHAQYIARGISRYSVRYSRGHATVIRILRFLRRGTMLSPRISIVRHRVGDHLNQLTNEGGWRDSTNLAWSISVSTLRHANLIAKLVQILERASYRNRVPSRPLKIRIRHVFCYTWASRARPINSTGSQT